MANEFNNSRVKSPIVAKEILILKIIILVAILILPLAFMFIDMSQGIIIQTKISRLDKNVSANKAAASDFQISIPPDYLGDINNVSQEKIDTLFDNLK